MPRSLDVYRRKRKGEATPEPMGDEAPASTAARPALQFVVQQHLARRMHWDLRLEWNGVLLSWAVPHGPSYDPKDKPLAVETEDHPLEYADFEGVIPAGNYGAGAMIVWDRGKLVPHEDFDRGFEKGKLLFELQGYKLRGLWTLVRIKKDPKNWLLIKERDAWARPVAEGEAPGASEPLDPRSVYSGLTAEELRDGASRGPEIRRELERLEAPRAAISGEKTKPMLAASKPRPFSKAGWIFELKIDGYRALGEKTADPAAFEVTSPGPRHSASKPLHAGRARLWYRSGIEAARIFPEIARALAALPYEQILLDGEVAALDESARPVFQLLQRRGQLQRAADIAQASVAAPTVYFAFDLLAFEGFDLRSLPLLERKRLLRMALPPSGPLRYADHIEERGEDLFREVRRLGVEGVVGKRAAAPYREGRHEDWIKVRADHEEDFVIVGMTPAKGSRAGFGAVHLAALGPAKKWIYTGRAGSGFSDRQLTDLAKKLLPKRLPGPICEGIPEGVAGKNDVWVPPEVVVAVRYVETTEAGQLRQPVFVRFRDDKRPAECALPPDVAALLQDSAVSEGSATMAEGSATVVEGSATAVASPVRDRNGSTAVASPTREGEAGAPAKFPLSNLSKVFWPGKGYTKGDLVDYYRAIAPWLLPYLADRPLVLDRYPDGIEGKSFFQKNAPLGTPRWLPTVPIADVDTGRETDYFVAGDVDALVYLANSAAIPLHVWASRVEALDHPDWAILDLDPKGAPFSDVVAIALSLRRLFDELEISGFIKTSGSSGMHVLLPLGAHYSFDVAKQLSLLIAHVVVAENPAIATVERVVERRRGKVYVDALQNGAGKLLVSPLCARPVPAASVSMPLRWNEVGPKLDPTTWDLRSAPRRMEKLENSGGDPFLGILGEGVDVAAVVSKLSERANRS